LTRMGFSLGRDLVRNNNWSWQYISKHRNDYVGWIVASPNKELGLAVEQYFFKGYFNKKHIGFKSFIEKTNGPYEKEVNELTLYEPWMNYDEY